MMVMINEGRCCLVTSPRWGQLYTSRDYCDEFASRYNTRDIKDNERFELAVKNSEGRLTYNNLIGK
jgi:hypothetical protein